MKMAQPRHQLPRRSIPRLLRHEKEFDTEGMDRQAYAKPN
jgi:hypothetical protein